jgi:hypothetical protein
MCTTHRTHKWQQWTTREKASVIQEASSLQTVLSTVRTCEGDSQFLVLPNRKMGGKADAKRTVFLKYAAQELRDVDGEIKSS